MYELSQKDVDLFKGLTNYDLSFYYTKLLDFFDNHEINVREFLSGDSEEKNNTSFRMFSEILEETSRVLVLFEQQSNALKLTKWFQVVEQLSDIETALQTLKNTPKYARTFLNKRGHYSTGLHVDHIQKQNQSLENISKTVAGRQDFQDAWYEIAIDNQLREEDTRAESYSEVTVNLNGAGNLVVPTVFKGVQSVQDTYGRDISLQLTIDPNTGDFIELDEKDTLVQCAENILLLTGSNPYNIEIGIPKEIIGSTVAAFSQNILVTSIIRSFQSDGSFTGVKVVSIDRNPGSDIVRYTVEATDLRGQLQTITGSLEVS